MRMPALRAYYSAPDPKICISYGACGCGGGIFHDLYCVWGGSDNIVPIDVYIPGCPPTPAATIYGFAMALGLLEQKLQGKASDQTQASVPQLIYTDIPLSIRITVEREARILAGYYKGKQISDKIMQILASSAPYEFDGQIEQWLLQEDDPRLTEIVIALKETCTKALQGEIQ